MALFVAERLELAGAVVDDADGRSKSQPDGAAADGEGILRVLNASADDGIDVDVEVGVFGEELELFVEDLEGFFGDLVGLTLSMEICM